MNDAARQALLALAGDDASNPPLFKRRFMELASREGLLAFRPVSPWDPPKRQAILRGLIKAEGLPGDVAEAGSTWAAEPSSWPRRSPPWAPRAASSPWTNFSPTSPNPRNKAA